MVLWLLKLKQKEDVFLRPCKNVPHATLSKNIICKANNDIFCIHITSCFVLTGKKPLVGMLIIKTC